MRAFHIGLTLCVLPGLLLAAGGAKRQQRPADQKKYQNFSTHLSQDGQCRHALARLTFGARRGDLEAIESVGLKAWINGQLHPEKTPEDAEFTARLAPFESTRLGIRETYVHYPPPRLIVAYARGRAPLPEDPELRATVIRLADRYLSRKQENEPLANGADQKAQNKTEGSDLDLKVKLSDILQADQIGTLKNGRPEDKRLLLASLPPEKWTDFVWALRPNERRQLFIFSPVELRRQLMTSLSPEQTVADDLAESKLLRAIYSQHQLNELLVDFWFNHFNVYIEKGADRYLVPTYERESIRPHVFGKFYDLLLATAESPAMLFYLDNWESVAAGSPAQRRATKNRRGLNENYARELLELHTLGVDGGYTQHDVIEVARCFTGWTIAGPRDGGAFKYNDNVHDRGQKVVLGHVIPAGGGMSDGIEVLNILAHHPSTARFISLKLAQRFVTDDPPHSVITRLTKTFMKTDGDLRKVLETMLKSPEFWSVGASNAKVKSPFELVVSAVRASGADVQSAFLLVNELEKLGEPLYKKIEPTGYKCTNAEWVSSAALLERMNFALLLASNHFSGINVDTADLQNLYRDIANDARPTPNTPSLAAALVLGSPDFQRH